jgi:hypothetical protein
MIGLIFAGVSKRRVSADQAVGIVEEVRSKFGIRDRDWSVPFDDGTRASTEWFIIAFNS